MTRTNGAINLFIGVIEKGLEPPPRKRPSLRAALVAVEMCDRVPLVEDRHRMASRAESLLAGNHPAVAAINDVLAEKAKVDPGAADRGRGQVTLAGHGQDPLLHMGRPPAPGILIRLGQINSMHQLLTAFDRVDPQPTSQLLVGRSPAAWPRTSHPRGAGARTPEISSRCAEPPDHHVPSSPASPRVLSRHSGSDGDQTASSLATACARLGRDRISRPLPHQAVTR